MFSFLQVAFKNMFRLKLVFMCHTLIYWTAFLFLRNFLCSSSSLRWKEFHHTQCVYKKKHHKAELCSLNKLNRFISLQVWTLEIRSFILKIFFCVPRKSFELQSRCVQVLHMNRERKITGRFTFHVMRKQCTIAFG